MHPKKEFVHFAVFYFLVFGYIFFGSGPFFSGKFFRTDMFYIYLLIIAIVFSSFIRQIDLIFESFRFDGNRWKSIITVLILFSFWIYGLVRKDGLGLLMSLHKNDLQVAFVEEIVFRGVMLGLALRLWKTDEEMIKFKNTPLPIYFDSKNILRMYALIFLLSVAFSIFHIWDLWASLVLSQDFLGRLLDRALMGFLYSLLYIWSGRKLYSSIALHYVNNVYA